MSNCFRSVKIFLVEFIFHFDNKINFWRFSEENHYLAENLQAMALETNYVSLINNSNLNSVYFLAYSISKQTHGAVRTRPNVNCEGKNGGGFCSVKYSKIARTNLIQTFLVSQSICIPQPRILAATTFHFTFLFVLTKER